MLNIGRLSAGAAEYYVGEVASSAEDYYTGHGELPGRWMGSLATDLGLEGPVEPGQFRAVSTDREPSDVEAVLGARPTGVAARLSYDRTADMLAAAHHHIARPAKTRTEPLIDVGLGL